MDIGGQVSNPFVFLFVVILLLQNVLDSFSLSEEHNSSDGLGAMSIIHAHECLVNMNTIIAYVLHNFRVSNAVILLGADLEPWVLPRSTTWFSKNLLEKFIEERWIQNFCMSKRSIIALSQILSLIVQKRNTRFRPAIPALVKVACVLYKLTHGASLLTCSESFAIGLSIVSYAIRDMVRVINIEFRHAIAWPHGQQLVASMQNFREFCTLSGVVGAIDDTHFHIKKPTQSLNDYYYYKTNGYSIVCQAVVDRHKHFIDVAVRELGSMNDARVLCRSALNRLARNGNLFDPTYNMEGFPLYLLGDKRYPLLPWLLVPHKESGRRVDLETLYNRKMRTGRSIVKNAFGILKQCFRELLYISKLHVTLFPDVVVCYCLLHNIFLGQSPHEVNLLLEEGMVPEVDDDSRKMELDPRAIVNLEVRTGDSIRADLGVFLGRTRGLEI